MRGLKTLKLLLVEDDLEDEHLLSEALLEIEENRQWCNWRTSSVVPVDRLADALDCLHRDSFHAVLLNLSLPDSPTLLDSFLEVSACAGSAPILVLADEPDENLANRLLREGAQDILVKAEIECPSLARAVRHAIERAAQSEWPCAAPRWSTISPAFSLATHSSPSPRTAGRSRTAGAGGDCGRSRRA